MKKIKKISNVVPISNGNVINTKVTSDKDTYSCDYINNLHKISTEEHVVGIWIDGRPIYEKTIITNDDVTKDNPLTIDIEETKIELSWLNGEASFMYNTDKICYSYPMTLYNSGSDFDYVSVRAIQRSITMFCSTNWPTNWTKVFTIRYIKSN